MTTSAPPTKDERFLRVHKHALELYAYVLESDDEADEASTLNERIMAVMLAAAWLALEGGVPNPWQRAYGPSPRLTRETFVEWASAMWDGWERERPRATLALVHGGRR